jgi:hypothetical protein
VLLSTLLKQSSADDYILKYLVMLVFGVLSLNIYNEQKFLSCFRHIRVLLCMYSCSLRSLLYFYQCVSTSCSYYTHTWRLTILMQHTGWSLAICMYFFSKLIFKLYIYTISRSMKITRVQFFYLTVYLYFPLASILVFFTYYTRNNIFGNKQLIVLYATNSLIHKQLIFYLIWNSSIAQRFQ